MGLYEDLFQSPKKVRVSARCFAEEYNLSLEIQSIFCTGEILNHAIVKG